MVKMKHCDGLNERMRMEDCPLAFFFLFFKVFFLSAKFTACMAELYWFLSLIALVSSAFSYHVFYLFVEAVQLHQLF